MIEHDNHRAGGEDALGGEIAIDGQNFFELAAVPVARAERVGAADQTNATAEVADVGGEQVVLFGG